MANSERQPQGKPSFIERVKTRALFKSERRRGQVDNPQGADWVEAEDQELLKNEIMGEVDSRIGQSERTTRGLITASEKKSDKSIGQKIGEVIGRVKKLEKRSPVPGSKGDQGEKGLQGDKGDAGDKGDKGDDGKSQYQAAVDAGLFTGTEQEWIKQTEASRLAAEKAAKTAQDSADTAQAAANEAKTIQTDLTTIKAAVDAAKTGIDTSGAEVRRLAGEVAAHATQVATHRMETFDAATRVATSETNAAGSAAAAARSATDIATVLTNAQTANQEQETRNQAQETRNQEHERRVRRIYRNPIIGAYILGGVALAASAVALWAALADNNKSEPAPIPPQSGGIFIPEGANITIIQKGSN